jgi:hypothetical protein
MTSFERHLPAPVRLLLSLLLSSLLSLLLSLMWWRPV